MQAIIVWRDPRRGAAMIYSARNGALALARGQAPAEGWPPVDRLLAAELVLQRSLFVAQGGQDEGRGTQCATAPEPVETGS